MECAKRSFEGEVNMSTVSIALPPIEADSSVDIEVSVNGRKRKYSYRIEVFRWSDSCRPSEHRAECLRRMVESYDKSWQLMQIGAPTEAEVPIMFRRTS